MAISLSGDEFIPGLLKLLKPYKKRLIVGLGSASIAAAFDVAGPMLLKNGVDSLNESRPLSWLFIFTGLILLTAAIANVFRFYMRMNVISVSRFAESDLRENFFQHILGLSPSFFDRSRTGDLMARATDDLERIRMVSGPMLQFGTNTILMILFSAIMMFMLDVVLAAGVLLLAPFVGVSVFLVARKLHIANTRQQETYSDLTSHVQENLTGIRVVKAFVREDHEAGRFDRLSRRYFRRSLNVAKAQAMFMPLLALLIGLGTAGILLVGGQRISLGIMTLGDFIAFMSYLSLMTWPMIALGWMTHMYQRGSASYQRVQKILSEELQFVDLKHDLLDLNKAPEIEFSDVTLSYKKNESAVLQDINLTIPSGSTVAIVGQIGSGKSSLVRMIPRLYSPSKGEIKINGKRWDQFEVESLRRSIGYVDQTPFLFSTTIGENISIGRPDATDAEIRDAAQAAKFDADIDDFPDKYATMIGERGITLSGGQQQRLILARALLMDPPVLILDDALSAVDASTESEILKILKNRLQGRTTLFVTHRLAAAEQADRILVLARGRLIEDGSHAELLELNGAYASMYRRQRIAAELGEMV